MNSALSKAIISAIIFGCIGFVIWSNPPFDSVVLKVIAMAVFSLLFGIAVYYASKRN